MEIIKIGNNSVKISLCTREVKELELSPDVSDEKIENSFLNLFSLAKIRASKGKLVADIFSGRDGSCEIFISRGEDTDKLYKDKAPQEAPKRIRQTMIAYPFEDFEKLLLVIKRLKAQGYSGSSMLYYDEERSKYYIMLDDVSVKELKFAFVSEYTKGMKSAVNAHIKEHYKCIFKKDAVRHLSKL